MQQPYASPQAGPDPGAPPGPGSRGRILVVDDDPTVAEVVAGYLDRAGFAVDGAADGPAALARAAAHRPDLVVLDLMLPGMDGLQVCRRLRAAHGPVPVVMLTARGDEEDRVLGLEVGADDYVTKPFSPRELVLRVESVLRRVRPPATAGPDGPGGPRVPAGPFGAAGLTVDPAARRATKNGSELALTLREFDLLAFFLRHPGRAFGREELMREVWGWDFGDLSTVTVHVRRLRGKVEDDPARPRFIQTVWGVGYRFDPNTPDSPRSPDTPGSPASPASPAGPGAPGGPVGPGEPAGPGGLDTPAGTATSAGPAVPAGHEASAEPVGTGESAGAAGSAGPIGPVEPAESVGPDAPAGVAGPAGVADPTDPTAPHPPAGPERKGRGPHA